MPSAMNQTTQTTTKAIASQSMTVPRSSLLSPVVRVKEPRP